MQRRMLRAIGVIVAVSGIACAVGGSAHHIRNTFDGEMRVALDGWERTVVRRSLPSRPTFLASSTAIRHRVAANDIPFEQEATRRTLDAVGTYDFVQLPFSVRLDGVNVIERPTPKDTLTIASPESEIELAIEAGQSVAVGPGLYDVAAIIPWTGLMCVAEGEPMAAITVRKDGGPWKDRALVSTARWLYIEAGLSLYLKWCASEEEARTVASAGIEAVSAARWGVQEGAAMHWFESFSSGTGIELRDRTIVTLLEAAEEHAFRSGPGPGILVHIERGGIARAAWIKANGPKPGGPVRFEAPAYLDAALVLYGWRDGGALGRFFRQGRGGPAELMESGKTLASADDGWEVRLDQVLASAAPVTGGEVAVHEALLTRKGREWRLRHGESVRIGDERLIFRRETPPPVVRYHVTVREEEPRFQCSFGIDPGETVRRAAWSFSQGTPGGDPERVAVIRIQYHPTMAPAVAGAAMLLAGVLLFVVARQRQAMQSP